MIVRKYSLWKHDDTGAKIKIIEVHEEYVNAVQVPSGRPIVIRRSRLFDKYTNIPKGAK